jgi:predicted DNA-binding transcriptional regulator YafY
MSAWKAGAWAQAAGFLERRESFRADYQTFAGKVSAYELGPLHLLAYHGNWYLLALKAAKGRVESFALSRFRRIEGLGRTFDRPQDFDARAPMRGRPSGSRAVRSP